MNSCRMVSVASSSGRGICATISTLDIMAEELDVFRCTRITTPYVDTRGKHTGHGGVRTAAASVPIAQPKP